MPKANIRTKQGYTKPIVSFPLEDPICVPHAVVGRRAWLDSDFQPEALLGREVIAVEGDNSIDALRGWLQHPPVLGVDSETTGEDKKSGLDPWRDGSRMVSLQLGTPDKVYLVEPDLSPYLRDVLENPNQIHLFQNAVYDYKYLWSKYGIHVANIFDMMLAEQLLISGLYGLRVGLADIVRRYPPYVLMSKTIRQDFAAFTRFTSGMIDYAIRDVPVMFPIYEAQKILLAEKKMNDCALDEFRVIPATAMMEMGGVPLSAKHLRLALRYWEARQQVLEVEIVNLYNEELRKQGDAKDFLVEGLQEVFDLQSSYQKLQALRRLGFDVKDTQRETLEMLDTPLTRLLAEYSNVIKITSTYGENLLARVNPKTGLLHPEFFQLGPVTGRYASDFQQIPKPVKRYKPVTSPSELALVIETFHGQLTEEERSHALEASCV